MGFDRLSPNGRADKLPFEALKDRSESPPSPWDETRHYPGGVERG